MKREAKAAAIQVMARPPKKAIHRLQGAACCGSMVATVLNSRAGIATLKTKSEMPLPAAASKIFGLVKPKPSTIMPKTGRTVLRMESNLCPLPLLRSRPRSSPASGRGHFHHSQDWLAACFFSKASIEGAFSSVRPMSSRPFSRQCLRKGSMSNLMVPPSGPRISWSRPDRRSSWRWSRARHRPSASSAARA